MRKILLTLMILAFIANPVHSMTQKQIQFVDEWGDPVNMGTSVSIYIYNVTTTTEQTCYTNRTGATAYLVAQAVEDNSTNTPLDYTTGLLTFWSTAAGYKLTVTDGTYTRTIDNLNASITRFGWPSYLVAMSSRTVGDDQTWVIGSETDVTFDWVDLSTKMTITAAADATIDIGADDYQFDLKLFADSDGDFILWDNDDESLEYVGAQAHYDDDSYAWFGSDKDFSLSSTSTKQLDILPLVGDETYAVHIGASGEGADLKVWGDTTDYILWDADVDYLHMVGDKVLFTLAEVGADQFKVDATGTIDGDAINFETSDGGIMLNADGSSFGDIELNSADDTILTSAGDTTATVTGTAFIDATGAAQITSSSASAASILLTADGGASSTIQIANSAGTGTDALNIDLIGGIDIEAVGKATLDITAATDGSGGFKIQTTVPTGLQLYGGVYSQVTVAGTTDGAVGAFRGRVDLDSSSAPVGYVQGARITVEEVGADMASAVVCPLVLETYCDAGGNDPLAHYMMRFNTSQGAEMPDAWFMAANPESIAYEANLLHGASATDKIGAIKIVIGGAIGDAYIYLYSTAGQ